MTRRFAVLGSPISHSKSPAMHRAAFNAVGEKYSYEAFELALGLREFVSNLDSSWSGLSLTMPLKEQALDLASRAHPLAISTKAANTLIRSDAGWDAYNTDVFGIQQAMRNFSFSSVVVLGTGATSRSAIVAMQQLGKRVSVWGRDPDKALGLATEYAIEVVSDLELALRLPAVISTIPGSSLSNLPISDAKGYLLDVAYHPWPTEIAKLFAPERVTSGLEMLLWQGVGQQRLFHGLDLETAMPEENKAISAMQEALGMAK